MSINMTITGNTTRDAELRFTAKGEPVASFTVAVNERVRNEDGTWGDGDPVFYKVSAWGAIATGVASKVGKGTRVIVTGTFKPSTYETKEGQERMSLEIRATEVGISTGFEKVEQANAKPASDVWADDAEAAPF
jgi:single-strand DNA-binding protein